MQAGIISMLMTDRGRLTIWHGDRPNDTCWEWRLRWLARGWAASTYNKGDSGLPCCTPERSGKQEDHQALKVAEAEVF